MKRAVAGLALALTGVCLFLLWQNVRLRHRVRSGSPGRAQQGSDQRSRQSAVADPGPTDPEGVRQALTEALPAQDDGMSAAAAWRHWAVEFFKPLPDEDLGMYRDRVLPVVQAVWDPQRGRVERQRERFEKTANLSVEQRREIDAAVSEASEALKDRLMQGILSEELMPPWKPTTAVTFARDVLDTVVKADQRMRASLTDEQLEALAGSPFDMADYLLFATRWEDLLNAVIPPTGP